MAELTLVRHGQANTGAQDEESYDRLSELGHRQAGWLGDYLRQTDPFERIVSGTLRRQIETARGLNFGDLPHAQDARLNEISYFDMAYALRDSHGLPLPQSQSAFAAHVPQVLEFWKKGEIDPHVESYDSFRGRITEALQDAADRGQRTLLVTSTGVIATLTALALGLDMPRKSKMFLAVGHTSLHKFQLRDGDIHLMQFGATPHLDLPERREARTFV